VVVVVAFQFVRTAPRPRKNTPFDLFGELIEGARAAWDNAACRHAIASVGAIGIVLSPFIAFIPAMSLLVLNTGKSGTGWLMTAQGVGAVAGAFVVPSIARRTSRLAVMRGSMVVLIASITLYGMAINYAVTLCALTVVGAAYIGTLNGLNTAVQLHAPAAERSRVLSLYTLSLSVSYPVGSLIQGVLEHHLGVSAVTVASGVVAAIVLLAVATLRPRFLRVMGAPAIT
jgi:predicted MFS family arabinose efflux permease